MRPRQYVAYYRVSTPQQQRYGLSFDAQRASVQACVEERGGKLVAEFSEARSGLKSAGPELREALRICRMRRAILVVARIDRLSRRVALTAALMDSDIDLAVADSPDANRIVLHIKAAFAEHESILISNRVKTALSEAKKRGVKLGNKRSLEHMRAMSLLGRREWSALVKARSMEIAPEAWRLRAHGTSLKGVADALNWQNIPSSQGRRWHAGSVRALLLRTEDEFPVLAAIFAARPPWRTARANERAEPIAPILWQIRKEGNSLAAVAREMNRRGIPSTRGRKWTGVTVLNSLKSKHG